MSNKLDYERLMSDYVQVGNEINPGFVLPRGNRWDGNEINFVYLLNAGITAVREAGKNSETYPKIISVCQPGLNKNSYFLMIQ